MKLLNTLLGAAAALSIAGASAVMVMPSFLEPPGERGVLYHYEAIAKAVGERWASRIWANDTSLWTDDPEVAAKIMHRLGWLHAPTYFEDEVAELTAFGESIEAAGYNLRIKGVVDNANDMITWNVADWELADLDLLFIENVGNMVCPSDFDLGVEPSIEPIFFNRSDVWNRRTNAPGGFNANNRPINEDPQQGGVPGPNNYGFALDGNGNPRFVDGFSIALTLETTPTNLRGMFSTQ